MIDELLKKYGLKFEDLKPPEQETLNMWLDTLQKGQLSVEKIREYVSDMKSAVERELSVSIIDKKTDTFLKARLRNYLLLEAFLSTPEKAKQQMEDTLSLVAGKKG